MRTSRSASRFDSLDEDLPSFLSVGPLLGAATLSLALTPVHAFANIHVCISLPLLRATCLLNYCW